MSGENLATAPARVPMTSAQQLDAFNYRPEKHVTHPPPTQTSQSAQIMRPWQHAPADYESRSTSNYDGRAGYPTNGNHNPSLPQDFTPYPPQYQYEHQPNQSNYQSYTTQSGTMNQQYPPMIAEYNRNRNFQNPQMSSHENSGSKYASPVNAYPSPLAPRELASVPQTPETYMPLQSPVVAQTPKHESSDIVQLKQYDPSWENWEMFRKDAKLTELFPGQRSQIRRCLLSCKQNMRESIVQLASHATKSSNVGSTSQSRGMHSKLLMSELGNVNIKEEKKTEQVEIEDSEAEKERQLARQKLEMERLEYERLMELYDGDRDLVESALQHYREERLAAAAAAKTENSADESATGKKRTARCGKKNEDAVKVTVDAVMPQKWCTTARTRAKATTKQRSPGVGVGLHMSDVIRDDATLAALGIPLSDDDSDKEDEGEKRSKISAGLRRPPGVSDDEYEGGDSEKSEESDQESTGDEDEEVDNLDSKPDKKRSSTGWLAKQKKGNILDANYVPNLKGVGRKTESDDDFVVASDDYDSEEAVAQKSDESSDEIVESEDSGDFGAKRKKSKSKSSSKKGKKKSRKRKAAFFEEEEEEEEISMVKSRGVRASKATKDYSEFFKKQKLTTEGGEVGEGGANGEEGEGQNGNESEMSEEVEEGSSDEYQASSDPEDFNVGKKAKKKARDAKMARLKAIREAKDNRRKTKKTSSDEDPAYSPKKGASPIVASRGARKKKTVINDDSDEDLGDGDFGGGGGGSQQYKGASSDGDDSDRAFDYNLSKPDKNAIVRFFNNSTLQEIQLVQGLSRKKADLIIPLRPFANWMDIVLKFKTEKGLNENHLVEAKGVIDQQTTLTNFLEKCESIGLEIEESVRNLCNRQSLDKEDNEDVDDDDQIQIVKQPQLLNSDFKLKPYQIIGLNWLYVMFKNNTNAVLSDEMGLGKTIQTIAFLAYLKENNEVYGKQMIIAPASTLENWAREFTDWCPSMKLFLYYGSQEERVDLRRRALYDKEDFDVIITTYNVCISNILDRTLFKKLHIQYMVIDEGHMLRNMNSQRYQQLMRIRADSRLLLTGTPLQNNLVELVSVLTFVMPKLFGQHIEAFKTHFQAYAGRNGNGEEDSSDFESARIEQAKKIMRPFMLRRLKKDVIKQLPAKQERIVKCQMTEAQRDCYSDIKLSLAKTFKDRQEGKEDKKDGKSLSNAMMQLRKATNHKLLHRRIFTVPMMTKLSKALVRTEKYESSNEHLVLEDLTYMSDFEIHQLCHDSAKTRKFCLPNEDILDSAKIRALDKLLPEIKEKQEKVLLFSQFVIVLDILQEYLAIRKHKFIRLDGSTGVEQRLLMIDEFNRSSSEDCFVFLLSTRAGGLGINLTSANHVIIHDIDFNPYNDKQAEDRAHRVGQEKEVFVYRLIVEDSIDEGMLAIADEKLKLEENLSTNLHKTRMPTDSNDGTPVASDNEDSNSSVPGGPQQSSDVATLLGNILEL